MTTAVMKTTSRISQYSHDPRSRRFQTCSERVSPGASRNTAHPSTKAKRTISRARAVAHPTHILVQTVSFDPRLEGVFYGMAFGYGVSLTTHPFITSTVNVNHLAQSSRQAFSWGRSASSSQISQSAPR